MRPCTSDGSLTIQNEVPPRESAAAAEGGDLSALTRSELAALWVTQVQLARDSEPKNARRGRPLYWLNFAPLREVHAEYRRRAEERQYERETYLRSAESLGH